MLAQAWLWDAVCVDAHARHLVATVMEPAMARMARTGTAAANAGACPAIESCTALRAAASARSGTERSAVGRSEAS